jgi:hypothetical protein
MLVVATGPRGEDLDQRRKKAGREEKTELSSFLFLPTTVVALSFVTASVQSTWAIAHKDKA